MEPLKQVLILCGGKATRLRPYSYRHSKAELPFLNLPLLAYPWKLAEDLENNSFLLNSHLFPEAFEKTIEGLVTEPQKIKVFFEEEPLKALGTLYALKKELQKTTYFTYINGDCLLFPSSSKKLFDFEKEFLNSKCEVLLYAIPPKERSIHQKRLLYCDNENHLREVQIPPIKNKKAHFFTGLALFKSSFLNEIKEGGEDLFSDFLQPFFKRKKIKVFIDEEALFLEAGDKESYLKSTELCLQSLYPSKLSSSLSNDRLSDSEDSQKSLNTLNSGEESRHRNDSREGKLKFVSDRLQATFQRFDPGDKKVGFKNGSLLEQKLPII